MSNGLVSVALRRLRGEAATTDEVDGDPVVQEPALPPSRPLAPPASRNDNPDPACEAVEAALREAGYLS